VTVIQGSTGSGKSTQVPQFILEEHAMNNRHCNIICTQPRRIAAKSVSRFVANTHKWALGSLVGYQIGMDKNVSESTRMAFVTTGVLLEKLVNQRNMNQYTHVILDEVS
jgi:ATP-dependent RNA helicase TDRD9